MSLRSSGRSTTARREPRLAVGTVHGAWLYDQGTVEHAVATAGDRSHALCGEPVQVHVRRAFWYSGSGRQPICRDCFQRSNLADLGIKPGWAE